MTHTLPPTFPSTTSLFAEDAASSPLTKKKREKTPSARSFLVQKRANERPNGCEYVCKVLLGMMHKSSAFLQQVYTRSEW